MLSTRGHRRNDKLPIRCPLCPRTGHAAFQCREFQITRREKKPNGHQRDGEHGGNGGGGRNGGVGRNGRGGESGGVGDNRGGAGSKSRGRGGGKPKKSSMDFESGDKTVCPDCYFCLESHKASEFPNRSVSTTAPATPNVQHSGFLAGSAPTLGLGCSSLQALARLWPHAAPRASGMKMSTGWQTALLPKIGPRTRLILKITRRPSPGDEVESAGGVFLPVAGYGRLRLLADQDNGTFKEALRELTLDRVAHVPTLGRHNLLSTKRLTTAFDAPMRVYPAAATIRPCFGRKMLVFRSLRPETGLLEIKACRRIDTEEPLTPLTTAPSMVTVRANPRHIMEFHRLLGHPSEEITRGTARVSSAPLTGTWRPCVQCSESRVRRDAVPKSTESRANERAERFFIDITGPFHATSLGGNRYAMLCVNDFTRFQFIRFLKQKSDATKELRELVSEHIATSGIKIGTSAPTVEEGSKANSNCS